MDFVSLGRDPKQLVEASFLAGIPAEEILHVLQEDSGVLYARAGQVIFTQGDKAEFTYFILSGRVRWTREMAPTRLGTPVMSYVAGPESLLGHYALLYDIIHPTSAIAEEPSELLRLSNQGLDRLLYRYANLRAQMSRPNFIGRLSTIPWLADLNLMEISLLSDVVERKAFSANETIYNRNESGDRNFYIIDRGQVDLNYGREGEVRYLGNGTVFGIYPLLTKKGYRNTATVRYDSDIFVVPHQILQEAAIYCPVMSDGDNHADRVSSLKNTQLFARLNDKDINMLLGYASHIFIPQHHLVSLQQESAKALWVLMDGSNATLHVLDRQGDALPKKRITGPMHFGEAALLMESPIGSTIEAHTDSRWLSLNRQDFLAFDESEGGRIIPLLNPNPTTLELRKAEGERRSVSWLGQDEALLVYQRRHWLILLRKMTVGLIMGGVLLLLLLADFGLGSSRVLTGLIWSVGIIGLLAALWGALDYYNDFLFVTNQRIVQQDKVIFFYERRREAPLNQVQDTVVKKGLIGNFLGYGDIVIQTASKGGDIVFDFAPDPERIRSTISSQVQMRRSNLQAQSKMTIQTMLEARLGIKLNIPERVLATESKKNVLPTGFWRRLWAQFRALFSGDPEQWTGQRKVVWRQHWLLLLGKLFTPFVLFVLSVVVGLGGFAQAVRQVTGAFQALELVAGLVGLVALGTALWIFADWRNDTYELTDNSIVDIAKLPLFFAENRREASLSEIQDIQLDMPTPIHYIFKFGDVRISTAATGSIFTFDSVPDPHGVAEEIRRRMEQWRIRDEYNRARNRAKELPDWFEIYKRLDSKE